MLEEEILYLTREKTDHTIHYLLVLPSDLKQAALNLMHNRESGHLGQKKSISKAEKLFYWPNLKRDVRKFVKECIICQQHKGSSGLQKPWLELPPVNKPLDRISIDITDMGRSQWLYICIDYCRSL